MKFQRTFTTLILLTATVLAKNANLNSLTFIRANIGYQYATSVINESTTTEYETDEFLMVMIRGGFAVGTAQIRFRLIGRPIEQITYVKEATFSPVKMPWLTLNDTDIEDYSPDFGFLTLVSNVFVKKFSTIDHLGQPALIRRHYRTHVGQKLLAIGPQMTATVVEVVPFSTCKASFDPKNVYLIHSEEQFCTTKVPMETHPGNAAFATPTALLFDARRNDVLVGIATKSKNGHTLSSLISFNCDFLEEFTKTSVCE
uniref:Peptidase S1 domain-containing protein n=1 Tax=Panagrellus redivivus TaxID=6233 RepID=A0A7E5A252_PANRE